MNDKKEDDGTRKMPPEGPSNGGSGSNGPPRELGYMVIRIEQARAVIQGLGLEDKAIAEHNCDFQITYAKLREEGLADIEKLKQRVASFDAVLRSANRLEDFNVCHELAGRVIKASDEKLLDLFANNEDAVKQLRDMKTADLFFDNEIDAVKDILEGLTPPRPAPAPKPERLVKKLPVFAGRRPAAQPQNETPVARETPPAGAPQTDKSGAAAASASIVGEVDGLSTKTDSTHPSAPRGADSGQLAQLCTQLGDLQKELKRTEGERDALKGRDSEFVRFEQAWKAAFVGPLYPFKPESIPLVSENLKEMANLQDRTVRNLADLAFDQVEQAAAAATDLAAVRAQSVNQDAHDREVRRLDGELSSSRTSSWANLLIGLALGAGGLWGYLHFSGQLSPASTTTQAEAESKPKTSLELAVEQIQQLNETPNNPKGN